MPKPLRHALLATAFLVTYAFSFAVTPVAPASLANVAALPMTLAPWAGEQAPPLAPEVAATLAADEYVRRYYINGQRAVEMDVSYYAQPRVGANMHSPLNCLPGNGWRVTNAQHIPIAGTIEGAQVRALTVERGTRRFAMAYWFQSRDRVVSGEFETRFHLLADALRRRPTDAGLVRVMAPVQGNESAHDLVLAFAARLVPELARVFRPA
jgi:EpsI family protein